MMMTKFYFRKPIAMESFGPLCAQALIFLSELGRRISVVTEDMREITFLFQCLSVAIQRFNCILFLSFFYRRRKCAGVIFI